MYPFTNNHGWADDGTGRGFDAYPREIPARYNVHCLSCWLWMGRSKATLEDEPQAWKCNNCRRVTYPNTRAYFQRLERRGIFQVAVVVGDRDKARAADRKVLRDAARGIQAAP